MEVRETHYLAVPSGENVNYYRLRVNAQTYFSDAGYHSGWYSADAVDSLFGDVSEAGATEALKTRNEIKSAIDQKFLEVTGAYLKAAGDPSTKPEALQRLLEARRAVRATASAMTPLPPTAVEMEYNPEDGLWLRRAGQKLVFVLSGNPDDVIAVITNFAEQQKTGVEVLKLADIIGARAANEVAASEAKLAATESIDELLAAEIAAMDSQLVPTVKKDQVLSGIESLRIMIDSVE